jgi:hypothetical protein
VNNIFIDLEGLGTQPGSAVTEIGAVAFDLESGALGSQFQCHVRPMPPFTADLETLTWHRTKGTEVETAKPGALTPREAVLKFLDWLDDRVAGPADARVFWSWGATYDFPMLEPLLDLRNPEDAHPWKYWQIRDARTVWKLAFGELRHPDRPHRAIDDAIAGITDLRKALYTLNWGPREMLVASTAALRSYQFGNASTALAEEVADANERLLGGKEAA